MTEQPGQINPDVATAYKEIAAKLDPHNKRFQYYDGIQPLVYSSERLRKVFREKFDKVRFIVNWCAVVINVALDRLVFQRFEVGDVGETDEETPAPRDLEGVTKRLGQLWTSTGLESDEEELNTALLVAGEAFVIAWPETDPATGAETGATEVYYNDPRLCYVHYDPGNPRRKLWAAKMWVDDDGHYRLVLYYPDRFEYYRSRNEAKNVQDAKTFELDTSTYENGQAPNNRGLIPVFHFRRTKRVIKGELDDVLTIQDGVNKLFADMMVVAEFAAFLQRYIVSDMDPGELENLPGSIMWFPTGDGEGEGTKVGEFGASDLSQYLEAMDRLAGWMSIISRTPKHYFYKQGGDPSGEALIAMEAPLNEKIKRIIKSVTPTWIELAVFLLQLDGIPVDPAQVTAQYAQPETVQPKTQAEIRSTNRGAGLPWATILREEGMSDAEIDTVMQEIADDEARATSGLAQALLREQRRFDQEAGATPAPGETEGEQ